MAKRKNQNAVTHGGAGAAKRLTTGAPFIGVALETQHSVEERLEKSGVESLVVEGATRLQTVCDLYFSAVVASAQGGKVKEFDSRVARFGWLQSKALLAWEQVRKQSKAKRGNVIDVLRGEHEQES